MAGEVKIRTSLDGVSQVTSGFKQIESTVDKMGQNFTRLGKSLSLAITTPLLGLAALASKEAATQEAALKKIDAVIKATGGAAGKTTQELSKMATALQRSTGVADDEINALQARLLTFRNITGDIFDRTTKAALDFAAVMGTDAQSAALMLGRALNNPAQGMMMLSRVGVSLSESLKSQIVELAESGKLLEAQDLLLKEITKSTGGAAAAMRDTFGGAVKALRVEVGDLLEVFGTDLNTMLRPVVEEMIKFVKQLQMASPETREMIIKAGALAAAFPPIIIGVGLTISVMKNFVVLISVLSKSFVMIGLAILGAKLAYEAWQDLFVSTEEKSLKGVIRDIDNLENKMMELQQTAAKEPTKLGMTTWMTWVGDKFTDLNAEIRDTQKELNKAYEVLVERLTGPDRQSGIEKFFEIVETGFKDIIGVINDVDFNPSKLITQAKKLKDDLMAVYQGSSVSDLIAGDEEDEFQAMSRMARVSDAGIAANKALFDAFNATNTKRRQELTAFADFELKLGKISHAEAIAFENKQLEQIRKTGQDKTKIADAEFQTRQKIADLSSQQLEEELKDRHFANLTIMEQKNLLEELRVTEVKRGRDGEGAVAGIDNKMRELNRTLEQRTFTFGARRAVANYFDELSNAGARAGQFITMSFKSLEDVLTNFFMTGKLSFQSFFEAITAGVARLLAQDVVGTLGQILGIGGAGTLAGPGGGGVLGGLLTGVGGFLGRLFTGGGGGGGGISFGGVADSISSGISAVGDFFSNLFFASGGSVFDRVGPGPIGDVIPALVDRREYVIRPESAKKLGKHRLDFMNKTGKVPRFGQGGGVWLAGEGGSRGDGQGDDPGDIGGGRQGTDPTSSEAAASVAGARAVEAGISPAAAFAALGLAPGIASGISGGISSLLGTPVSDLPAGLSFTDIQALRAEIAGLETASAIEEGVVSFADRAMARAISERGFGAPGDLAGRVDTRGFLDRMGSFFGDVVSGVPASFSAGLFGEELGISRQTGSFAGGLIGGALGTLAFGPIGAIVGSIIGRVIGGARLGQAVGGTVGSLAGQAIAGGTMFGPIAGFAAGLIGQEIGNMLQGTPPGMTPEQGLLGRLSGFLGGPGGTLGPAAGATIAAGPSGGGFSGLLASAIGLTPDVVSGAISGSVETSLGMGAAGQSLTGSLGSSWARVVATANDIVGSVPSFASGGSRVFSTPSLISVGDAGPELIEATPLAGGAGRGGSTVIVRLGAGSVIDDMSFYSFTRRISREMDRRISRGFGGRS